MRVGRHRFEELVAQALDGLPEWVHRHLENVDVLIEERPPPDDPELLGLYEGVPLTERDGTYFGVLPDRITLFRSPLLDEAEDEEDLRQIVQDTVIHEIAHFFGISDDRLREMDRY